MAGPAALLGAIQPTDTLLNEEENDLCRFSTMATDSRILSNEYHVLTPLEPVTDVGQVYNFKLARGISPR